MALAAALAQDEAAPVPADALDPAGLHVGYYLLCTLEGFARALATDWPELMASHEAIPGVSFGNVLGILDPTQDGPGSDIAALLYDPAGIEARCVLVADADRHLACHMAAGRVRGKGVGVRVTYVDGAAFSGAVALPGAVATGDAKAVRWLMGAGLPDELGGLTATALATTLWRISGDLRLNALAFGGLGPAVIGPTLRAAAVLWGAEPNLAVKALR